MTSTVQRPSDRSSRTYPAWLRNADLQRVLERDLAALFGTSPRLNSYHSLCPPARTSMRTSPVRADSMRTRCATLVASVALRRSLIPYRLGCIEAHITEERSATLRNCCLSSCPVFRSASAWPSRAANQASRRARRIGIRFAAGRARDGKPPKRRARASFRTACRSRMEYIPTTSAAPTR